MLTRVVYGYRVNIVVLLLTCIIMIFIYGYYLRSTKTSDILGHKFYDSKLISGIDGWSITHFLFFFLIGILYPNHHLAALSAGTAWEYTEQYLGTNKVKISGTRIKLVGDIDSDGNYNDDSYWYAKTSDIIVNIFGYSIGSYLAPCPNSKYLPCNRK